MVLEQPGGPWRWRVEQQHHDAARKLRVECATNGAPIQRNEAGMPLRAGRLPVVSPKRRSRHPAAELMTERSRDGGTTAGRERWLLLDASINATGLYAASEGGEGEESDVYKFQSGRFRNSDCESANARHRLFAVRPGQEQAGRTLSCFLNLKRLRMDCGELLEKIF
jgi:hypothetical protein